MSCVVQIFKFLPYAAFIAVHFFTKIKPFFKVVNDRKVKTKTVGMTNHVFEVMICKKFKVLKFRFFQRNFLYF